MRERCVACGKQSGNLRVALGNRQRCGGFVRSLEGKISVNRRGGGLNRQRRGALDGNRRAGHVFPRFHGCFGSVRQREIAAVFDAVIEFGVPAGNGEVFVLLHGQLAVERQRSRVRHDQLILLRRPVVHEVKRIVLLDFDARSDSCESRSRGGDFHLRGFAFRVGTDDERFRRHSRGNGDFVGRCAVERNLSAVHICRDVEQIRERLRLLREVDRNVRALNRAECETGNRFAVRDRALDAEVAVVFKRAGEVETDIFQRFVSGKGFGGFERRFGNRHVFEIIDIRLACIDGSGRAPAVRDDSFRVDFGSRRECGIVLEIERSRGTVEIAVIVVGCAGGERQRSRVGQRAFERDGRIFAERFNRSRGTGNQTLRERDIALVHGQHAAVFQLELAGKVAADVFHDQNGIVNREFRIGAGDRERAGCDCRVAGDREFAETAGSFANGDRKVRPIARGVLRIGNAGKRQLAVRVPVRSGACVRNDEAVHTGKIRIGSESDLNVRRRVRIEIRDAEFFCRKGDGINRAAGGDVNLVLVRVVGSSGERALPAELGNVDVRVRGDEFAAVEHDVHATGTGGRIADGFRRQHGLGFFGATGNLDRSRGACDVLNRRRRRRSNVGCFAERAADDERAAVSELDSLQTVRSVGAVVPVKSERCVLTDGNFRETVAVHESVDVLDSRAVRDADFLAGERKLRQNVGFGGECDFAIGTDGHGRDNGFALALDASERNGICGAHRHRPVAQHELRFREVNRAVGAVYRKGRLGAELERSRRRDLSRVAGGGARSRGQLGGALEFYGIGSGAADGD